MMEEFNIEDWENKIKDLIINIEKLQNEYIDFEKSVLSRVPKTKNELESTINDWINNKINLEELRKCKIEFDEGLWEVEGLCVLMRRDVFKLVRDVNIFKLFIGKYSVTSDKVRNSLMNLIDYYLEELKTSKQHNWGEHAKICFLWVKMNKKDKNVIGNSDEIFEYIVTVIEMSGEKVFPLIVEVFSAYPTSKVKCWLMKRLDWLMKKLDGEVVDCAGHRNVAELIWYMLRLVVGDCEDEDKKYHSNILNQQVSDRILAYMMRLLDREEHDRAKVLAIVNLELMCVTNRVDTDAQDKLRQKLSDVAEKVESAALTNQQFNSVEHQIGWCAKWCLDNLWDGEGPVYQWPVVKLSPDRIEARNDELINNTVRSSFGVEVVLITQRWIRIGWSTRDAKLGWWNEHYKIGDDANSIAFEVQLVSQIIHNNIHHPIAILPSLQPPTVVGCLIDTHNRQFVFYLNGHKIDCPIDVNFSISPYYATACLVPHQQCRFNFGQEQFKYPPQNIIFENFKKATNGDSRKYQLVDTEDNNKIYWFKHSAVDNQVDLLYRDTKQHEHDDFVRQNEHHIANNQTHKIDLTRVECTRFIQSVIEVMHTELNDDECIRQIITKQLSLFKNPEFLNFNNKMFELIYPYTQLQFNPENNSKCHNLGIILISILNLIPNIPFVVHKMSLNFLLSTKLISIETLKKNAKLVTRALSGFDGFKINERTKQMLLNNQTFTLTLKEIVLYGQIDISDLYGQYFDSQTLQAAVCAKWWIDQLFSDASENLRLRQATLNATDRSAFLKISSDRLSARSDFYWQSVRSIDHNCPTYVNSDFYYFEVVLLTDGPMRIGWATRRTDLNESQIGKDHLSISFDGFTRAVRHQGEVYQVDDIGPWKAGDVIGCAIDKTNGQFAFSLNGQPLSLPSNLHFSSLPYHAAVSLSPHQQVYFNFGQAPFKYGQQKIDYWDFHLALSYRDNKPAINFGNSKLSQNVISINSAVTTGDILIQRKSFNFQGSSLNETIKSNPVPSPELQLASIDQSNLHSHPNPPSIPRPHAECRLCTEPSTTKLLRFVCCPNLILCLDCVKRFSECPKCAKQSSNKQASSTSSRLPVTECRLCFDQTQTRALLFLCCDIISLCLDCVKLNGTECPKCLKQLSNTQSQSTSLTQPLLSAPAYLGLSNLGNTCFINSILQCLQKTNALTEGLLNEEMHMNQNATKSKILCELVQLFNNMKFPSKFAQISPNSIVHSIFLHIFEFTKGNQEDAHEFLVKFLEILHSDLNSSHHPVINNQPDIYSKLSIEEGTNLFWMYHKIQNKSIITDLFEGLQQSTTRCSHCDYLSRSFEPFNCLSLSIPSMTTSTIDNCIKQYTEKESFVWTCPKCSQTEASKWISLIKLPQILIIHLKRFELLSNGLTRKLTNLVHYPLNGLSIDCTEQSNVSYNLYGIVEHVGKSMAQGHYVVFCRNVDGDIPWHKFDDLNVSPVTNNEVACRTAYILFYQRTNKCRMQNAKE